MAAFHHAVYLLGTIGPLGPLAFNMLRSMVGNDVLRAALSCRNRARDRAFVGNTARSDLAVPPTAVASGPCGLVRDLPFGPRPKLPPDLRARISHQRLRLLSRVGLPLSAMLLFTPLAFANADCKASLTLLPPRLAASSAAAMLAGEDQGPHPSRPHACRNR